ncbi:helix-turn-helix domain-containing protein [uncultured Dysosmobacter sp.]|uniref:helix-turn-helix domain-containing protein n=1 Tax=uncultured Dysosmobacter sp. TaxID=2591384 RepID=UPI0026388484|nr:helix-turn-helix transcriptional regulator [uncultured Dysosmobacter sp.]
MTFPENLLKLRKAAGLSQTALASKIGISWRTYQTYERGEREPSLSTLVALADLYDISLDELVCRTLKQKENEV